MRSQFTASDVLSPLPLPIGLQGFNSFYYKVNPSLTSLPTITSKYNIMPETIN